ncbi:MAG: UDP-N-acetylglucosamine 2-epimerase (non-hydrolyzing) [Actinomycetota bacterium]
MSTGVSGILGGMSGRICFVVGARPNFMKVAPVLRALESEVLLVHTGQHYDDAMSDAFVRELGLPEPNVFLGVGSGTHGEQIARALIGLERVLLDRRPAAVVVAGDVNSTLAAAIAAAKAGVPLAHIESGLRSFDPSMPEEHNRKLTDHLSQLLLAHSQSAVDNLTREGIDPDTIELVGNTMIDSLVAHVEEAKAAEPWRTFGLERGEYGLVTLHRPGLVDEPQLLQATVEALTQLATAMPLVFPVHPRTRARLGDVSTQGLHLTPPLGYHDFLGLEACARFVLTDSGGVQEETSALGIPCFTLRDSTERPVTIELGTNILLGVRPDRVHEIPALLPDDRPAEQIPFWDGHAGERAADAIRRWVDAAPLAALAH